jgi:hypothetical protein
VLTTTDEITVDTAIEWISPVKDYLRIVQTKQLKMIQSSLDPWLSSSDNMLRVYAELSVLLKDS